MRGRIATAADFPAMRKIWKACFGDGDEYIDGFFSALYRDGNAVVVEDGDVVGAGYLIPLGDYVWPDGRRKPCAVTYALGVLPECQGGGGGGILSRETLALAERGGYVPLICPAEPSLFEYYGSRTEYRTAFCAQEREYDAAAGDAVEIDAEEYLEIREKLLAGRAHVDYYLDIMKYQHRLCKGSGGGLYKSADGSAICAVEGGDGFFAKELLGEDAESLAGAAAHVLGAEGIRARVTGGDGFAMAAGEDIPADGWFGFAFD